MAVQCQNSLSRLCLSIFMCELLTYMVMVMKPAFSCQYIRIYDVYLVYMYIVYILSVYIPCQYIRIYDVYVVYMYSISCQCIPCQYTRIYDVYIVYCIYTLCLISKIYFF